ncbi:hypothetical protein SDC9_199683 [bioreactor metagenome]|uniref:Uncharacterized protein n=1 Tax=bioreactor metagenome TaxID=1076179 RepID=A0A645IL64_9ZZZZ
MRDCAQGRDDMLEPRRAHDQRVAPRNQDIPDFLVLSDIFKRPLEALLGDYRILFADDTPAGAVTAVHRALQRNQEQHPVRIAVYNMRHGAVSQLVQRVGHIVFAGVGLLN